MTEKTGRLSRRELLAGAALTAGAAAAPGLAVAARRAGGRWDHEADVVCVGGGAAGCAAAVAAVDAGATVILVERAPLVGGTTRKSGGVAWVPNNPQLRAAGVDDRREDAIRYMARFAYPHRYVAGSPTLGLDPNSYALLEAFYDHGSAAIELLARTGVVEFGTFDVGGKPAPDYADHLPENKVPTGRAIVPKDAHGVKLAGGAGDGGRLVDACEAWLTGKGAAVLTEHRVTRVVKDGERVVGVEATHGEKTVRIRARRGVIFGTGGFAHNLDLIQLHHRFVYGSCAVPYSQGDFLAIAQAAGAKMGQLDTAWRTQILLEQAVQNRVLGLGVFFVPADSMIIVNKYGKRVVDEKRDYNDRTRVHYYYDPVGEDYPNQFLFMVFDERSRDAFGGMFPIPAGTAPYLISGATLDELASGIRERLEKLGAVTSGCVLAADFAASLGRTVDRFNAFAKSGVDEDFGRGAHAYDREWQKFFSIMRAGSTQKANDLPNATMYPIAERGPYHAVILAAGVLDTNGGPVIDASARVLGADGRPIPGLYGAGNCISAPTRDAYMGAGGTIGPALTFGYIAGRSAAGAAPVGA
jgi:succinate dehydrogenase/fumarate reductase flavoprotein subunit